MLWLFSANQVLLRGGVFMIYDRITYFLKILKNIVDITAEISYKLYIVTFEPGPMMAETAYWCLWMGLESKREEPRFSATDEDA